MEKRDVHNWALYKQREKRDVHNSAFYKLDKSVMYIIQHLINYGKTWCT